MRRAGVRDRHRFSRPTGSSARRRLRPASKGRGVADSVVDNIGEPLTLARLAGLNDPSTRHFARAFKMKTGLSPYQLVISARLTRARLLLQTTTDSVALIAAACDFADQAHLTRVVKARFGVTPGEYRHRL